MTTQTLSHSQISLLSIALEIGAAKFDDNAINVANQEVAATFRQQAADTRALALAFAQADAVQIIETVS